MKYYLINAKKSLFLSIIIIYVGLLSYLFSISQGQYTVDIIFSYNELVLTLVGLYLIYALYNPLIDFKETIDSLDRKPRIMKLIVMFLLIQFIFSPMYFLDYFYFYLSIYQVIYLLILQLLFTAIFYFLSKFIHISLPIFIVLLCIILLGNLLLPTFGVDIIFHVKMPIVTLQNIQTQTIVSIVLLFIGHTLERWFYL